MTPIIYDRYGTVQPWDWLIEHYGAMVIHPANDGPGWRCVELHENADIGAADSPFEHIGAAAIIMVKARNQDGSPAANVQVAWYWPDAPLNPAAGPVNGVHESMRPGRADQPGVTNSNGDVGFGMGPGAYYFPPNQGPHATWMYGKQTNSDVVLGLGMLGGTNHDSIWPVFQWVDEEAPSPSPSEPPGNGDYTEVVNELKAIRRILEGGFDLMPK